MCFIGRFGMQLQGCSWSRRWGLSTRPSRIDHTLETKQKYLNILGYIWIFRSKPGKKQMKDHYCEWKHIRNSSTNREAENNLVATLPISVKLEVGRIPPANSCRQVVGLVTGFHQNGGKCRNRVKWWRARRWIWGEEKEKEKTGENALFLQILLRGCS